MPRQPLHLALAYTLSQNACAPGANTRRLGLSKRHVIKALAPCCTQSGVPFACTSVVASFWPVLHIWKRHPHALAIQVPEHIHVSRHFPNGRMLSPNPCSGGRPGWEPCPTAPSNVALLSLQCCRCSSAAGELVTSGALAAAQQLMAVAVEAPLQFVLTHDKGAGNSLCMAAPI